MLETTGSGGTLAYDWDGNGTGETNLPVGNYTYLVTAITNGLALPAGMSASGGGGSPPSPSFMDSAMLWAMPSGDSGDVVPFGLYPPGFDTNSLTVFEATPSEMTALINTVMGTTSRVISTSYSGSGGASPNSSGGGASQATRAPKRPPINPVKGRAGVYGVAYDTYSANGSGYTLAPPDNGLHIGQHIGLEGDSPGSSTFLYPPLTQQKQEANAFIAQMKKGNWSQGFSKVDDGLKINDLRSSGGNIFNTVKLGLFLGHAAYGTTIDYNANGAKQIYFAITSGRSATYIGMSEMSLGSSATNGLKWMAFSACNSLDSQDWTSMKSKGVAPNNSNLHIILGANSVTYSAEHCESY